MLERLKFTISALLVSGWVTAHAEEIKPSHKSYTLRAEQTWQMNLPGGQRFDASGLFLDPTHGLLTESDQQIGVYKIEFSPGSNAVNLLRIPNCFTPTQLAPFAREKVGHYDCEGITEDDRGRIYLCEEGNRWVLRWDPVTKTVERLNIDWTPVKKYFSADRNASWEGIAIHGQTMYLANERKTGRIIVVDLGTLKITDHFAVAANRSLWFWDAHYSDLAWYDGALYVLMREDHVILKLDPKTHAILAEYDFKQMEHARDVDYNREVPFAIGVMEGLAVDKNYFWLCTDNNGQSRKKHPGDTRPTLFKCRRSDTF